MCLILEDNSYKLIRSPPIGYNSTATARLNGRYCTCDDTYANCKRCRTYNRVASIYDRLCNQCKHPKYNYRR